MMYFDEDQVRALLRYDDLIPAMEEALRQFSLGEVIQPVRTVLTIEEDARFLGVMPAAGSDVMGVKLVSAYPKNAGTAAPTHSASILLFRTDTGEPIAVMGGTVITEMRTAAVSAAITKYLMPANPGVLALLGSGVQAHAHLEALRTIAEFKEVRIWSRTREHAQRFAGEHDAVATDAETAVRGADVIVVATYATQPVLKGAWLKPGAHVNAVGANRPNFRELDDEAMRATIVVDSRDAALREAGDIILSNTTIAAEAGEIFAGRVHIPRSETTVFESNGLGIEDIATARLVVQRSAMPTA